MNKTRLMNMRASIKCDDAVLRRERNPQKATSLRAKVDAKREEEEFMLKCPKEIDLERDISDPYVAQVFAQKSAQFQEQSDAEDAKGVRLKDKQYPADEKHTLESIREANPLTLKEYMTANPIV